MKVARFEHRFVEHFPDQLDPGVLYISLPFASSAHGCACGCGREVVTPLSPVGWSMTFDGASVSLTPSIGNDAMPCRSHYWIKHGAVVWSYQMSREEVAAGRRRDQAARDSYYGHSSKATEAATPKAEVRKSAWSRLVGWLNKQ